MDTPKLRRCRARRPRRCPAARCPAARCPAARCRSRGVRHLCRACEGLRPGRPGARARSSRRGVRPGGVRHLCRAWEGLRLAAHEPERRVAAARCPRRGVRHPCRGAESQAWRLVTAAQRGQTPLPDTCEVSDTSAAPSEVPRTGERARRDVKLLFLGAEEEQSVVLSRPGAMHAREALRTTRALAWGPGQLCSRRYVATDRQVATDNVARPDGYPRRVRRLRGSDLHP